MRHREETTTTQSTETPPQNVVAPRWLSFAKGYLGEKEKPGKVDNQFILDCFKHTAYSAAHDEVPWCAAFVCRVLDESGFKGTKSAAAMSYAKYGDESELTPGAIVVLQHKNGGHHVTFFDHMEGDQIVCLGGNQGNEVKYSSYPKEEIFAVRWPTGMEKPETTKIPNGMQMGARGPEVEALQAKLQRFTHRFFPGSIDGIFGIRTEGAIKEAQRYYNFPVTGVCTPEFLDKISKI